MVFTTMPASAASWTACCTDICGSCVAASLPATNRMRSVSAQAVDFEHHLVLATQVYSVLKKESVWAIESRTKIKVGFDEVAGFSVIVNEAKAITSHLSKDGLIE